MATTASYARARLEEIESLWTCFTCDYEGCDCDEDEDENESCPVCGTISGDGFGMAMNDPRMRDEINRLKRLAGETA